MKKTVTLDNVDTMILDFLKERGKGTLPKDIIKKFEKHPQCISRTLAKLRELDLVVFDIGSDRRKRFYTAR